MNEGLKRAADEGTGRVEKVVGHDVNAGLLALLLSGVRPHLVNDLVDVYRQVSGAEQGQDIVEVQTVQNGSLGLSSSRLVFLQVDLVNKGLERAANEGAGRVQHVIVHDVNTGLLTLLLSGVRSHLVDDLVDVMGQV